MIKKLVVAAVMLMFATPAFAQIHVTGEGKVAAEPDMATVTLGVVAEDVSSSVANDKMNKQLGAVLDKLKELKLADKDLCTVGYDLSPKYVYTDKEKNETKLVGFVASSQVHVKVRDLKVLGTVVESAVKSGATSVRSVKFDVTDSEVLMNKARELALADAKAKAKLYASNLGVKVGVVKSVQENEPRRSLYDSESYSTRSTSSGARLQAGEKTFAVEVVVTFEVDKTSTEAHEQQHGRPHPAIPKKKK